MLDRLNELVKKTMVIANKVNNKNVEEFLKRYPYFEKDMMPYVKQSNKLGVLKAYIKYIKHKDEIEDNNPEQWAKDTGGWIEKVKSPTFGLGVFVKFDWGGVDGYAEIFQYLYNRGI